MLLNVLPIAHNLPLACPGMQGFLLSGGTVRLSTSSQAQDVFAAIDRHRVTHIHVVPALLIRWINDPGVAAHDLGSVRVIQSGASGCGRNPGADRAGVPQSSPCRRTSAWRKGC